MKAIRLIKKAVKWYLEHLGQTNAFTPTGIYPYIKE